MRVRKAEKEKAERRSNQNESKKENTVMSCFLFIQPSFFGLLSNCFSVFPSSLLRFFLSCV